MLQESASLYKILHSKDNLFSEISKSPGRFTVDGNNTTGGSRPSRMEQPLASGARVVASCENDQEINILSAGQQPPRMRGRVGSSGVPECRVVVVANQRTVISDYALD
jgi:hypothetical protein